MFKVSKTCYQGIMQEITSLVISWSPKVGPMDKEKKIPDTVHYTHRLHKLLKAKRELKVGGTA